MNNSTGNDTTTPTYAPSYRTPTKPFNFDAGEEGTRIVREIALFFSVTALIIVIIICCCVRRSLRRTSQGRDDLILEEKPLPIEYSEISPEEYPPSRAAEFVL